MFCWLRLICCKHVVILILIKLNKMKGVAKGEINIGNVSYNVRLPFIIFEEDNSTIVYCPPLELSGYGSTENDAKESFRVSLEEFLRYTTHKDTLKAELKRLGWKMKNSISKPMIPPTMEELLRNNSNFSRVFNRYNFRKSVETIRLPAIA
jgi:hypothetical protein